MWECQRGRNHAVIQWVWIWQLSVLVEHQVMYLCPFRHVIKGQNIIETLLFFYGTQDGPPLQRGRISVFELQRWLSVSWNALGPRVRWERPHVRLALLGRVPDVPWLWHGNGKRRFSDESMILKQWSVFVVLRLQRKWVTMCTGLKLVFPSAHWRVCTTCLSLAQRLYWIFLTFLKLPETVTSHFCLNIDT